MSISRNLPKFLSASLRDSNPVVFEDIKELAIYQQGQLTLHSYAVSQRLK